jgi:hypothetical protein
MATARAAASAAFWATRERSRANPRSTALRPRGCAGEGIGVTRDRAGHRGDLDRHVHAGEAEPLVREGDQRHQGLMLRERTDPQGEPLRPRRVSAAGRPGSHGDPDVGRARDLVHARPHRAREVLQGIRLGGAAAGAELPDRTLPGRVPHRLPGGDGVGEPDAVVDDAEQHDQEHRRHQGELHGGSTAVTAPATAGPEDCHETPRTGRPTRSPRAHGDRPTPRGRRQIRRVPPEGALAPRGPMSAHEE